MQAAKRDENASLTPNHNICMVMWAVDRFKRYGRYSGHGKLFWLIFGLIDRY